LLIWIQLEIFLVTMKVKCMVFNLHNSKDMKLALDLNLVCYTALDLQIGDQSNGTMKRKGRVVTKKDDIFSRTLDMPKLKILLNGYGQLVGENARKLSSAIGFLVRKKISISCVDWRLIDINMKCELWADIKSYFDIGDAALNWAMRTTRKKWKEFKATIKEVYFNPELTIEEVGECPDKRVSDADWKFLYNYWMTSEFEVTNSNMKCYFTKCSCQHLYVVHKHFNSMLGSLKNGKSNSSRSWHPRVEVLCANKTSNGDFCPYEI
jgi:hypothetical protein